MMKAIAMLMLLLALPAAAQSEGLSPRHRHIRAKVMATGEGAASPRARLATLLVDVQNSTTTLSASAWRAAADEATALAKRLEPSKNSREVRKHIADMRAAALRGDVETAKHHAALALPLVLKEH